MMKKIYKGFVKSTWSSSWLTGCVFFPYDYTSFSEQPEKTILIKNVNIIDVEADSILLNYNILIVDGTIAVILSLFRQRMIVLRCSTAQ
jgi:hypothetical protein